MHVGFIQQDLGFGNKGVRTVIDNYRRLNTSLSEELIYVVFTVITNLEWVKYSRQIK